MWFRGFGILAVVFCTGLLVQGQTFSQPGIDFTFDLPSPSWRVISRLDVHDHVEFVNEDDPANGYLRIRKSFVTAGATAEDLFRLDEKLRLQSLPGYIVCGECEGEPFKGHLVGKVYAYEFTSAGRVMAGRIYYLQLDTRTFYSLHFTVARDKLKTLTNQMDSIASSFRIGKPYRTAQSSLLAFLQAPQSQ